MNTYSPTLRNLLISLAFFCILPADGQDLIKSRTTSYYTYIYSLTNTEARKIYHRNIWIVDSTYFHTLIDSIPTDSMNYVSLKAGHYLKTYSDKNQQKIFIATVQDFDVYVLNNNTDLCIQVYDLEGNLIPDARVRIHGKTLRFDERTKCYTDKRSNRKGFLSVTYEGFTSYYELTRRYNNSGLKRGARTVLYRTPLRYAWIPVAYTIRLPIDGVKSLISGYPRGTIRRTGRFFVSSFERIACLFDEYYCDYYTGKRFQEKHHGYLVFNKPLYQPGDTVKFKAFVVDKKGKGIRNPVKVVLERDRKDVTLTTLSPYRDGGFEYQFILHDSLDLRLDQHYYISLCQNSRKQYIRKSFRYEDYELASTKLTLRVGCDEHFRNKTQKIFIKGTNENDLNLLDARIELLITPVEIEKYFYSQTFIPDTLLFLQQQLEPYDETEIILPDSIFPKANFSYKVSVKLITSDNETKTAEKQADYFFSKKEFTIVPENDSLCFTYHLNGDLCPKEAIVYASDNFGNRHRLTSVQVPCRIELNPCYSSYTIMSDSTSATLDISGQPSLLRCLSVRTKDSLKIAFQNPRKLPFTYTLYKKNHEKEAGYTDSLVIKKQISNPENYYLSVRFLWGGRIQDETYKIPYADRKLTVSVTQPKIVYPGQRSRIEVLVTDADGEPVPGVDLTAYGLTLKFNYTAPSLPDLNEYRKEKTVINNFSIKPQQILNSKGLLLDYETWKLMASADTIEYYKFIYPDSVIYRYEYYTDDSLTQFSPFIVSEGEFQPVHVIWVDSKPVYFSWSTHTQPYSFRISSGLHQVKIRTDRKTIFFDNLYFPPGKKLIFSIDENREYKQVSIMRSKPELSSYEQRILYNYIFPYRYDFGDRYAYIEQEGEVQLLKPDRSNRYNNLAGPVSGKVTFSLIDSFSTIFTHEPYFEYDFSPGLLKMRSVTTKGRYPEYLSHFSTGKPLTDTYYTKDRIHREWIRYLDLKRYNTAQYRNPSVTCEGAGKLLVEFEKTPGKTKDLPLNILLFRYDDHRFTRVYPGNARLFHDLDPGYHRMIFFYTGAKYHVLDSVLVRANGTNYYEISQPQSFRKDTFSLFVSDLIEKTLFSTKPFVRNEYKELRQIFNSYSQQFSFTGEGEIREGYVYDAEYGDALPGVTVLVKGTTIGTITDINGYYCLKVPSANSVLEFNYVGYSSEEVPAGSEACRTVHLSADILALDEVVVVGYGTTSAQYCTGAVSTVTSESLLNSLPGMESQLAGVLSGKVAGISIMDQSGAPGQVRITIRGASSPTLMDKPLFIIDGNVYTGDISDLPADMIENLQILKDESATAIYGAQGANGVVIISTKSGGFKSPLTPKSKGADYDDAFFGVASQASSIRDNFSDYAFWEPRLITDSAGRAVFEVQFPDDVTSWKTYFLAMNEERQTGQAEDIIKSYKPMMAQLAVPRFLVESDTCYAIGKILNYTADSLKVITKFELDGIQQQSKSRYCVNSLIDSLPVIAREDSIAVKYYLEKEDGYFDGELKNIPVFPVGLEETSGSFIVMDHDTAVTVKADSALGIATVYARADILEVLEDEISHLIHYKYGCNEQIASKLKALLADKAIAEYRGKKFTSDRQVQKMIRLLLKNQKSSGLWGWWKNGADSYWISLHVVEALTSAQFAGYPVRLNQKPLSENLVWELENSRSFENSYRLLKILGLLQAQIDYSNYILKMEQMEQMEHRDLNSLLKLQEIRQLCHLNYDVDTLKAYRQTTLFGNVFFSDEELKTSLTVNDIQNTLLAYRILRNDSITDPEILRRIRNYFMEQRHTGYWGNTYEAASILVNLLPDLLKGKEEPETPELFFEGDTNMIIREFPFKTELLPGQSMQIRKEGDFPVYLTSYQRFWNKQPCEKKGDFAISTCFENIPDNRLKAGQEVKLVATLVVHKDAEYVMVNIPVPGGCSYASKKTYYGPESHREYFRQETAIFLEELKRGTYTFEIELTARYTGSYTLNPAKVELMYFPTFSANNRIKRVIIE